MRNNKRRTGQGPESAPNPSVPTAHQPATLAFSAPTEFVIPGQNQTAAALDIARTVVRRAERSTLKIQIDDSFVGPYLNRLSDLMWMLARWQDQGSLSAREIEINKEV